jgi:hypothetical protein
MDHDHDKILNRLAAGTAIVCLLIGAAGANMLMRTAGRPVATEPSRAAAMPETPRYLAAER